MSEKLCVFCRHIRLEVAGYETSGYNAIAKCGKGYWEGEYDYMPNRATLLKAETCPAYDEAKP